MVKALILAAGEGQRLGYNKMLRPILGKPMIFWTLDNVCASGFNPQDIVVVVGYKAEIVKEQLLKYNAKLNVVENPNYQDEMFSSIKAGIWFLPEDIGNILIVLGDQPLVKASSIKAILLKCKPTKVVQPVYKGKRCHPLLIPEPIIRAIRTASLNYTLKDFMPNPEERVLVPLDDEGLILDIDTPDDLKKAETILKIRLQEADAGLLH